MACLLACLPACWLVGLFVCLFVCLREANPHGAPKEIKVDSRNREPSLSAGASLIMTGRANNPPFQFQLQWERERESAMWMIMQQFVTGDASDHKLTNAGWLNDGGCLDVGIIFTG